MVHRRGLITGLISLVAAPAIVRVSSLMPVKVMEPQPGGWMTPGSVLYFSDDFNGHAAGTPFFVIESTGNTFRIEPDRRRW